MADANEKFLGKHNLLYIVDGVTKTALACETESSVSISRNRIEVSCKGSGGYTMGISGDRSMSISASSTYSSVDDASKSIVKKILADDVSDLKIVWGDIVNTGGLSLECAATFDSVDVSAPDNDLCTLSLSMTSNGVITITEKA